MNSQRTERRRSIRYSHVEDHGIVSARIRPGHAATVIDVSAGGALVETPRRLLPGSTVEIQVERTEDRLAVRGTVSRCGVSRIHSTIVWYRGAIVFDSLLPWFPESNAEGYRVLSHESRSGTSFRAPVTPQIV
jgi:hypothetical protein